MMGVQLVCSYGVHSITPCQTTLHPNSPTCVAHNVITSEYIVCMILTTHPTEAVMQK